MNLSVIGLVFCDHRKNHQQVDPKKKTVEFASCSLIHHGKGLVKRL